MSREIKVAVRDLRAHLSDHLRRVTRGASVMVTSRGQPMARLVPVALPEQKPRQLGFMKGQITMAPDFDETPVDVLQSVEVDLFPPRRAKRRP
jgi:prevent-host-death family protein